MDERCGWGWAKAGDGDFLRSVAEAVVQLLMETDGDGVIGAGRHERSGERTIYRNGYRDRTLDTRLGSLQLRIPKLRLGNYFPPFLEPLQDVREGPRRRHPGLSCRADQRDRRRLHPARRRPGPSHGRSCPRFRLRSRWNGSGGLSGISKSTVSKLCKDIDDRVNAFLDRPLVGDWPYLWLDATYLKQREGGRTVELCPNLGDDGLRRAAYRGGWKPA